MAWYKNENGELVEEQPEFDDMINVDVMKYFGRDIYNERGYATRKDYLEALAEDYGADRDAVFAVAELLGPSEDFDGLIVMIEDGMAAGLC